MWGGKLIDDAIAATSAVDACIRERVSEGIKLGQLPQPPVIGGEVVRAIDIRDKQHHDHTAVEGHRLTREAVRVGWHGVCGRVRVSGPGSRQNAIKREILEMWSLPSCLGEARGVWGGHYRQEHAH